MLNVCQLINLSCHLDLCLVSVGISASCCCCLWMVSAGTEFLMGPELCLFQV